MKPFLPAFLSCAKRSTMRFMRGESLVCRWLVASCKLADALEWAHLPSPQRLRLLDTATAGPRTVPVRSSIAGGKAQECSRPPRPRDVLRAGTARAPMGVSCTRARSPSESALDLGLAACLPFMLMDSSAQQVVNLVVNVAVDAG